MIKDKFGLLVKGFWLVLDPLNVAWSPLFIAFNRGLLAEPTVVTLLKHLIVCASSFTRGYMQLASFSGRNIYGRWGDLLLS